MTSSQKDIHNPGSRFLEYLRRQKNDRGAMADLRRAINPAQAHRAWPLLAPFGGIGDERLETIAALFAYHPEETTFGNLGTTCRRLSGEHSTFDGRFRRLLACNHDDICRHIRPVILAAKAKGIAINYQQLYGDLFYWGDAVKARWAEEFWSGPSESASADAEQEASL
jgi:CRISPR system Cascade subunit CasB